VSLLLLALLVGCDGTAPAIDSAPSSGPFVPLDDARLLRRLSLDLRGRLPSLDELDAVAADPAALDSLRDDFLDDPAFEERLVALFSEHLRTRIDDFQVEYYDYALAETSECVYEREVGQEAPRLLARIVVDDLPWSTAVTADWTMATEALAAIWPLERLARDALWEPARYTDGRPPGGVLSTNGLWWRYVTSRSNANRSRVAALSELLLCQPLLSRPVSFATSPSLVDEDGTAEALRSDPQCLACHASIEPLAAAFFGWVPSIDYNPLELGYYHPERESQGPETLGVDAAYYGVPLAGFQDVGPRVAADSRFYRCAAETAAKLLWRRPIALDDFDQVEDLRRDFVAGDTRFGALLAAVTDTPEYRAADVADDAETDLADRARPTRMLSPDQLATALDDLAGFSWTLDSCDQLDNDDQGYRVLAGGVDGHSVTRPQQDPGLTWALVVERAAQGAAGHAVQTELVEGQPGPLFRHVTLDDLPGEPAWERELSELHWRLFAQVTDERLDADRALWQAVADDHGAAMAWIALVTTLLRDPYFVST